jgi:hypothetical protein
MDDCARILRWMKTVAVGGPNAHQIVMDTSGDTRHQFDPDDPSAVAEAERRFRDLIEAGFTAAKRTGSRTSELLREFRSNCSGDRVLPKAS